MYLGEKDWRPELEVPAECCYLQNMSDGQYVEVRIPQKRVPEEETGYYNGIMSVHVRWKSFMVRPDQVYHKNAHTNIITGINKDAGIRICEHIMTDRYRPVPDTYETLDVFAVMSRLYSYYVEI